MYQLDLKQRVAVITGGARSIGFAIAERVLRSGGRVSLCGDCQKFCVSSRFN